MEPDSGPQTDHGNQDGAGAEPQSPEDKGLLKALQAEREKRQAIADELAALKAAREEAERKAAEEAGEHKRLYDDLLPQFTAAQQRLTEYEQRETERRERQAERNTERLGRLPKAVQDLAPAYDDPYLMADWIEKASGVESTQFAAGTRAAGGGARPSIPQECASDAARVGKSPEDWFPIWVTLARSAEWRKRTNYRPG